jgi:hypothetical protein
MGSKHSRSKNSRSKALGRSSTDNIRMVSSMINWHQANRAFQHLKGDSLQLSHLYGPLHRHRCSCHYNLSPQSATANATSELMPQRRAEAILVGSFNIQTFGQSKMGDPWVMGRLAEVIRMFEVVGIVVGIQEIRSTD